MPRMTGDEYRDFLVEGTRTAKLATSRPDGSPHVVPVWFVMDGEDLIFTTGRAPSAVTTGWRSASITRNRLTPSS